MTDPDNIQAFVPHHGRQLKLLLLRPPKDWQLDPDVRETVRKLCRDCRKILEGTEAIVVPDGWEASVVEVDGIGVNFGK
jgi:hypothetical protein